MARTNESSENYLEAILILEQRNQTVRMSDVAAFLSVSKPSVNKAINALKDSGYALQQHYGNILLTPEGREYAVKVYQRHLLFKRFFTDVLEVAPDVAEEEACHMEHCISDETMVKFKDFLGWVLDKKAEEQQ